MTLGNGLKLTATQDVLTLIPEQGITASQLNKETGITYCHMLDIIKFLKFKKFINSEQNNINHRIKDILLTKSGKKLQDHLREIKNIIE